jgi:trans-aconitate methyltransferase
LAALHKDRYRRALEPGCSIGEFTALLAPRCNELLAFDFAPSALVTARARCQHLPQVKMIASDLLSFRPEGEFDLIVLSEVGYYFQPGLLHQSVLRLQSALQPGGELLAAHWLGTSPDHVMHGDAVHEVLREALSMDLIHAGRHDGFRVDAWIRS